MTKNTVTCPLGKKKSTATSGFKTFKKEREINTNMGFKRGYKTYSTRGLRAKLEVVTLNPNQIFTNIQEVRKNRGTQRKSSAEKPKSAWRTLRDGARGEAWDNMV